MSERITFDRIGAAVAQTLEQYRGRIIVHMNEAGAKAVGDLVRITKKTAPHNAKAHHRHYRSCITSKVEKNALGEETHIWYVKAPCHRLTHLLVRGHAKRGGGETRADPFLQNAVDQVLPQYERDVKEAVRIGK